MSKIENILDFWPFEYEPRPNQIKALEWLGEQDAKYLLLEAPVGAGKSNIGVTLSRALSKKRSTQYNSGSIILTPQRILQDQYERSFLGNKKINMASFYGKSNYECEPRKTTCDIGSLVKPPCVSCPYALARDNAKNATDTVLNYKLGLLAFAFTQLFKPRQLLILDECHTLEQHLVDFDAVKILEFRCKKYNVNFKSFEKLDRALEWMEAEYIPDMDDVYKDMYTKNEHLFEMYGDQLTRADLNKIREINLLKEHIQECGMMVLSDRQVIEREFVLVWDKISFQFKRLTGAHSFNKYVKPMANRFLFMSSTILNKEGFCRDLGIPAEESAFLSLSSEFNTENRPVYFMPQMKMNAAWNKDENIENRKDMLKVIHELLDIHKDSSGIVHTGNFAIAKWLVENIENKHHNIHHHNPGSDVDRNTVIDEFQADAHPSILISPSCTEGLDLKDDLARFAMFVKVPFGFLGDQWIKKRMELSQQWYQRRALIDVIQGGGRVVRSPEDWGDVYILDQSWAFLFNRANHMIPQWWKDAYHRQ